MTDTDEQRLALDRGEMVAQWLLAAVTDDDDRLDELQDATEQSCVCCSSTVTRALARLAGSFAVQLHGQTDAEDLAERMVAGYLDELSDPDKADE